MVDQNEMTLKEYNEYFTKAIEPIFDQNVPVCQETIVSSSHGKKRQQELSLLEKSQMINEYKAGVPIWKLMEKYNQSRATVYRNIQNKKKVLDHLIDSSNQSYAEIRSRKRLRKTTEEKQCIAQTRRKRIRESKSSKSKSSLLKSRVIKENSYENNENENSQDLLNQIESSKRACMQLVEFYCKYCRTLKLKEENLINIHRIRNELLNLKLPILK